MNEHGDKRLVTDPRDPASTETKIIRRYRAWIDQAMPTFVRYYEKWAANHEFISPSGSPWSKEERHYAEATRQPQFSINDTYRVVVNASGKETTGRYQPKLSPREDDDHAAATIFTEGIRYERQRGDADVEESEGFFNFLVQGVQCMAWPVKWLGSLPKSAPEAVPIWEMMWDINARGPNLHDREWACRFRRLSHSRFMELFGSTDRARNQEVEQAFKDARSVSDSPRDAQGDTGGRTPLRYERVGSSGAGQYEWEKATVAELEWRELSVRYIVTLPGLPPEFEDQVSRQFTDNSTLLLELQERSNMRSQLEQAMQRYQQQVAQGDQKAQPPPDVSGVPSVERKLTQSEFVSFAEQHVAAYQVPYDDYIRVEDEVVRYAFIAGRRGGDGSDGKSRYRVLRHGLRPERYWHFLFMTDRPTLKPTGPPDWQSLVDRMKDPQLWANKAYNLQLILLSIAAKNSFWYSDGAFEDAEEAQVMMARPGALIKVLDPSKVQPIQQGNIPSNLNYVLDTARQMILEAGGTNAYDLGSAEDLRRTSGRAVSSLVQAASLQTSRSFDALRSYRLESAKLLIRRMLVYWSEDDLKRVVGSSAEVPPKARWERMEEWDLVVDEAPMEQTSEQDLRRAWVDTGWLDKTMGTPLQPPAEALVSVMGAELPPRVREEWQKRIEESEMTMTLAQQLEQRLAQLESQMSGGEPEEEVG